MKDSQVLMMRILLYFRFTLLLAFFSIMAGCGVRSIPDDCPVGVIRIQLDWDEMSGSIPQGKWLILYSDDKPTEPFVQEVDNVIYIDTLPPGCYRALLLAMEKDITRLDFIGMEQFE